MLYLNGPLVLSYNNQNVTSPNNLNHKSVKRQGIFNFGQSIVDQQSRLMIETITYEKHVVAPWAINSLNILTY